MDIKIREYNERDQNLLAYASEKLHDYIVQLDPIKRLRKAPGYVEHATKELLTTIKKQEGKIYIADDNGKFCGFIAGFTMQQSKENLLEVIPSKLREICDLYIEKEYRGRGIGATLIGKMEKHLKDMGCDAIWINIVAFNKGAHHFYSKHGYIDREIGLIKRI